MDLLLRIEVSEAEVLVWDVEREELRMYRRVETARGDAETQGAMATTEDTEGTEK